MTRPRATGAVSTLAGVRRPIFARGQMDIGVRRGLRVNPLRDVRPRSRRSLINQARLGVRDAPHRVTCGLATRSRLPVRTHQHIAGLSVRVGCVMKKMQVMEVVHRNPSGRNSTVEADATFVFYKRSLAVTHPNTDPHLTLFNFGDQTRPAVFSAHGRQQTKDKRRLEQRRSAFSLRLRFSQNELNSTKFSCNDYNTQPPHKLAAELLYLGSLEWSQGIDYRQTDSLPLAAPPTDIDRTPSSHVSSDLAVNMVSITTPSSILVSALLSMLIYLTLDSDHNFAFGPKPALGINNCSSNPSPCTEYNTARRCTVRTWEEL
ncbi:hypothetical protein EVAR_100004_1 [Eumeta japonica]|uniref:Uncharacterized protein n=1 Tax=Eumeta variegata TaxID=151549 RepID=A0A4C2A8D4_EUMVA|nr:hypothetical protein EVAR_100004_1 [Eumeta japonica]